MSEKLEITIKNLKHLLRLKSIILKEKSVGKLLTDLCTTIVEFQVYDVAWAVLVDSQNNVRARYSSLKNMDVKDSCWQEVLKTDELYVYPRNKSRCKHCVLSNNDEATLLSKRISYNGNTYGVFSISINSYSLDDSVKIQFEDLVDDISTAIYSILLKEEKEKYHLELLESQHVYKRLLETSSLPLGILNLDYEITFMSKSLKEMFGLNGDDNRWVNEKVKGVSMLTKGFEEEYREVFQEVLDKDILKTEDVVFSVQDGLKLHTRLKISLLRSAGGNPIGYMIVFYDLSTEMKTADELRMSEEKFRLLFMNAPNGVALLSPKGVILDYNDKEAKMLQMERSDLIGSHISTFLSPESNKDFTSNFEDLISKGEKSALVKLQRKDGLMIIVNRYAEVLKDKNGKLTGIVVHTKDVTEELKAQGQIKLLLAAIEQSSSIFTITDLNGKITYVNKRFSELTGFTPDEVLGKTPRIIKSGKHDKAFYKDMWNKLLKGEVWEGEFCNKRKDGEIYWEFASLTAIKNADGELINLLKVAEDITLRKKTERESFEAKNRYQNIFNLVPNPIVIHVDGFIVDVNKAAVRFAKVSSKKDLLGADIMDFVHESSQELIKDRLGKLMKYGGEVPVTEANMLNIKGEVRTVKTVSKEVPIEGERAFMVVFEDITEQKQAEQKLKDSEKRFRSFFNLIPDPVVITNLNNGYFIEVNEAALKLGNMSKEEALHKSVFSFGLFEDEKRRHYIFDQLKTKGYVLNEEMIVHVDGKEYTILVSGIMIEPYKQQNVLFVAKDISVRKQMIQDLVLAKEKAEAGERLKSLFLSNMSHEIRTPMNAILGFSDLLRDSTIDETYRNQYIDIIQQRGRYLLKMISDIMDVSKIESGSIDIQNRAVKVKGIVEEVLASSIDLLKSFPNKNIEIQSNCQIEDAQLVNGDKYRIKQVLVDLMDNAVKFTQNGNINISCWLDNDEVRFLIEDTGYGIAKEKIEKAFERFVQVHDVKAVTIGGSGLGLSIAKSLIELMGGRIWIESVLNEGTKVFFTFKAFDGGDAFIRNKNKISDQAYDWSDKTILIAEDEPSNQMYIKVILGKTNVNLIIANDGKEALELFEKYKDKIDLVLLDIMMPRLNGYEVTKIIKKQRPETIIVALTANAMNDEREVALKNGCDDYLAKPIEKKLLYETLNPYMT